ncbi:MAG: hypothetical protein GF331_04895 [Chitinivibrionales bacterium]|nr:hypothetical protein [Chitinivibrionales bacterium]
MRIAREYRVPFVDRVEMQTRWASWLITNASPENAAMRADVRRGAPTVTWEWDTHGWIPWMQFFYDWRFADVMGRGEIDMVQTNGMMRQTAFGADGGVLWDYHDPDAPFVQARYCSNFPIVDIDGDGIPELICPRMVDGAMHLCIVNARTGMLKRHIPYPFQDKRSGDMRAPITVANVTGKPVPSDIVLAWDYRWVGVLDSDLDLVWEHTIDHAAGRRHTTMGHTPFAGDIDGDGHDEIMAGSCLIDHTGEILWVADDLPALCRDGHADSVQIHSLAPGEGPRVLMSTGAYCFSREGRLLWGRDELKHGQALKVGRIRGDIEGRQVVVYEGASRVDKSLPDKVIALTRDGDRLWEREVVQPDMQEGGFGFWLGDWDGDGFDEVFVNDPEKVNILNGYGEVLETIPGHLVYVFDLVGDLRAEAVVVDTIAPGMTVRVIENDAPNRNPTTGVEPKRRETTREMYDCTRY